MDIEIEVISSDGTPYNVSSGDKILFSVKRNSRKNEFIFQKEFTDKLINILPTDTNDLPIGDYVYDVKIYLEDGKQYTIIPPTKLILQEVINNAISR